MYNQSKQSNSRLLLILVLILTVLLPAGVIASDAAGSRRGYVGGDQWAGGTVLLAAAERMSERGDSHLIYSKNNTGKNACATLFRYWHCALGGY